MANTHRAFGPDQIVQVKNPDGSWSSTHMPLESFTLPFQIFVLVDFDNDFDDTIFDTATEVVQGKTLREIADGLEQASMVLHDTSSEEEKDASLAFIEAVAERLRECIEFG